MVRRSEFGRGRMSIARRFQSGAAPDSGILFVGGKTASSGGSSISLNVASGLSGGFSTAAAQGDFAICFAVQAAKSPFATAISLNGGASPGWSEEFAINSVDTYQCSMSCATKYFSTLSDTELYFTKVNRSDTGAVALAMVFRDVDSATQLDVAIQTATGVDSASANPPSITPTTTGAIVVGVGAAAHSRGVQTFSSSDLTKNFQSLGYNTSLNDPTLGAGWESWVSGAFDPAAFTFSGSPGTAFAWSAATLAIRPAT